MNPLRPVENYSEHPLLARSLPDGTKSLWGKSVEVDPSADFGTLMKAASKSDGNADITRFLTAGMALSDDLCTVWFRSLGASQARSEFGKELTGNLGALTAVLLGITGAGSVAVSAVAAGTSFATKTIESGVNNFIVAPDVGLVERGIQGIRDTKAGEIVAALDAGKLNFYRAYSALIAYDNTCSHNEVKRYVNVSISRTNDRNIPATAPPFYTIIFETVGPQLKALFKQGATATLNLDAATALYALNLAEKPITASLKAKMIKTLEAAKLYVDGKPDFATGASAVQLKAILRKLDSGDELAAALTQAIASDKLLASAGAPAADVASSPAQRLTAPAAVVAAPSSTTARLSVQSADQNRRPAVSQASAPIR